MLAVVLTTVVALAAIVAPVALVLFLRNMRELREMGWHPEQGEPAADDEDGGPDVSEYTTAAGHAG